MAGHLLPATMLLATTILTFILVTAASEPSFQFTKSSYNASIAENAPVRTYVSTEPKTGINVPLDSAITGVKYSIDGEDRLFRATDEKVGDFVFLRIRTVPCKSKDELCSSVINREQKDEYQLRVKAEGRIRGQSPLTTYTNVVIRVSDVNDQRPLFSELSYSKSIPEDIPVQTNIITVEATDADLGTNSEVYYSFKGASNRFAIHPTSGVVTLTRPLDYRRETQYQLVIVAKDRGMMPYSMAPPFETTLSINVLEVNKYAPVVAINALSKLSRNSELNAVLASITVTDNDDGSNGYVSYVRIVDGDPDRYFKIVNESNTFYIKTQKTFKSATSPSDFNLTIVTSDAGSPPKTSTGILPVHILGSFVHSTIFQRRLMNVSISELVPINTPIMCVASVGMDPNTVVLFSLADNKESSCFTINERTGYITLKQELDREDQAMYNLTVYANIQDSLAVAYVIVYVLDANDNSPLFEQEMYEFDLQENLPINTPVVRVVAHDADLGENSFISYSLANVNPVPFTVNHMTGYINTSKVLDYETMRREYRLRVRASDWGSPFRRESEVIVTIRLQNINDNRPQFEKIDCVGTVSRTLLPGENIAVISAIDFDGDSRELSIVSGNPDDLFSIDHTSGNLTLRRQIEDTDRQFYSLRIIVSDGRNSASYMFTNISINNNRNIKSGGHVKDSKVRCKSTSALADIADLYSRRVEDNQLSEPIPDVDFSQLYSTNNNQPRFDDSFPSIISVKEDAIVGNEVVSIKATDSDPGYNGMLVYAISDGNLNSNFIIDFETGVLSVLRPLDRERDTSYELTIKVSDLGQPRMTEKRHATINIEDVNDNAPEFDQSEYVVELVENEEPGLTFLDVHASDRDVGRNRDVRYSIISDSPNFAISSGTGELRVTHSLDRETDPVHNIRVHASDMAPVNSLSSVALVTVNVLDVNDNAPQCIREIYSVKIREDLPVGSVFMSVQAVDPDFGTNGLVTFAIAEEVTGTFSIDKDYGTMRLISKLDFESRSTYDILVNLKDRGSVPNLSTCHIFLQVVDVNENRHPPQFEKFYAEGTVLEDAAIGTAVMTLTAEDLDSGLDGFVSYSIRDGSGLGWFSIDQGGTIHTSDLLDRESIPYFWLIIYAQDHGAVPLHSVVEVFIRVADVNDNRPQPTRAMFEAFIPENSPALEEVIRVEATDPDDTSNQALTYEITAGDVYGHFAINIHTGVITTTDNTLDREVVAFHTLQVTIHDNGRPSQSATTNVLIHIEDENDNAPSFKEKTYSTFSVPARDRTDNRQVIYRAIAMDADIGENAELSYFIREGNEAGKFDIDATTGIVSTTKLLPQDEQYNLVLEVLDNGRPTQQRAKSRLLIIITEPLTRSPNEPFILMSDEGTVSEKDVIGTFVTIVFAVDDDGDDVWYSIKAGDDDNKFYMGPTTGEILIASELDAETQSSYLLTVGVSDGFNEITTPLRINVLNSNDNSPLMDQLEYTVDIHENTTVNTEILRVRATDRDRDDLLTYTLDSVASDASLSLFQLDSLTGALTTRALLDREVQRRHVLTVQVKDYMLVTHRNYTRVIVNVLDSNDHTPEFGSSLYQGTVFETATVGTRVTEVYAYDRDQGTNAELVYSIVSVSRQDRPEDNIGDAFNIDPVLGTITVSRALDREQRATYVLNVQATDRGVPPLSSRTTVTVTVTLSNNAPPRFTTDEYVVELLENQPANEVVKEVAATSRSSVYYRFLAGNEAERFDLNANTGVITTQTSLDFEEQMFYNLTVEATNMVGLSTTKQVLVHIQDVNDNRPHFTSAAYAGRITESALLSSVVLDMANQPLVIAALDDDSNRNAQLVYRIVEAEARGYFTIDQNTGAIRTRVMLDHEAVSQFSFMVQVEDSGVPPLRASKPARVTIGIVDINDSPPEFTQEVFEASLLLPTFKGVTVVMLTAVDRDTVSISQLEYSIMSGNQEQQFAIDATTGAVMVADVTNSIRGSYEIDVRVTDGLYYGHAKVMITAIPRTSSELHFLSDDVYTVIQENDTAVRDIAFLTVLGNGLNEPLVYSILNPDGMFDIRPTSGVLRNTGMAFDRETQEQYDIVVEVTDMRSPPRMAHVIVHVQILDINDNVPVFVHHLFNAIVQVDAKIGEVVRQVTAVDKDEGVNGEIKYTLVAGGSGHFDIDSTTGTIIVRRPLDASSQNKNFTLKIKASDKGKPRHSAVADVPVMVQNKAMPVFQEQYYHSSIPENIQLHSAFIQVQAISPHGRDVLYSISDGDEYHQFDIHPNTGVVIVIGPVDFESKQAYRLTVQASDMLTAAFASVMLDVAVSDVNDIAPSFRQKVYRTTLSEAVSVGSTVARVLADDLDSPANARIEYRIATEGDVASFFHLDPNSGLLLTSRVLDYERFTRHDLIIVATDSGVPMLTGRTRVSVDVLDMNDNAPVFTAAVYECTVSQLAQRGDFVTVILATDPDVLDVGSLRYSIVSGNDKMAFAINGETGIISLSNTHEPTLDSDYTLNVSVSDHVFTSSAQVRISLVRTNHNSPEFGQPDYNIEFPENKPAGSTVYQIAADDLDPGVNGVVTYSIISQEARQRFEIDAASGEIITKVTLDREKANERSMTIPIMAADPGGRTNYANVNIILMDKNDNRPQFERQEYEAFIPAGLETGAEIIWVSAYDVDLGSNSQLTYYFDNGTSDAIIDQFEINTQTGLLSVRQTLQGKESSQFQFFMKATDGGSPALIGRVPVSIYVLGPGDTPPIFQGQDHLLTLVLSEDHIVGDAVTTLRAESNGSTLTYSLVPGTDPRTNNPAKFSIGRDDGTLTVAGRLDYEACNWYKLIVKVETDGAPAAALAAFVEVSVSVVDVNDNAPVFDDTLYEIHVPENVVVDTEILRVRATDIDSAAFGKVAYHLASSDEDDDMEAMDAFAIDAETGAITTMAPLDREILQTYTMLVVATDGAAGDVRNMAEATVYIVVGDVNDSPPRFTRASYSGEVSESASVGTVVLSVFATDADLAVNAELLYYVTNGDPMGRFAVECNSGKIYVARELDRELRASYTLNVTVTDGAFMDTTLVTVVVLDVNDNAPYCMQIVYSDDVTEGLPPGTDILQVSAVDADAAPNAILSYTLTGHDPQLFTVNERTGLISSAGRLDYETQPLHQFEVLASDGTFSCSSQVYIGLFDENDNAPVFSASVYNESVSENTTLNSLLTRVQAIDPDTGVNRQFYYSLGSPDVRSFTIDRKSGILTLRQVLDRENQSLYNVTLRAVDANDPSLVSQVVMVINVLDENDNEPQFEHDLYNMTMAEDAVVGATVVKVEALTKDVGVNALITYQIISGNEHGKFDIHMYTGDVVVAELLDYEMSSSYYLTIKATDSGLRPLSDTTTVSVYVTDANDNAPQFSQIIYMSKINEAARVGDSIVQVLATDADSGAYGDIAYSLVRGDWFGQFSIDDRNGLISVAAEIDREQISSYSLIVRASDAGEPAQFNDVSVQVLVVDINDNPPRFDRSNYTVIQREDMATHTSILQLNVTDPDSPVNGPPFTFSIIEGNDDADFSITPEGSLTNLKPFNRELKGEHRLVVQVTDNGMPRLSSVTHVVVEVVEPTNVPVVESPVRITIKSSEDDDFPGGVIGRVRAHDLDPFDILVYELANDAAGNVFRVDPDNGRIHARPDLDAGYYQLNVSVNDGQFTAYCDVQVTVEPVTQEMLENGVTIRFRDLKPVKFLSFFLSTFKYTVSNILRSSESADVDIISIQESDNEPADTEVLFAVRKSDRRAVTYFKPRSVERQINVSVASLEERMLVRVRSIVADVCTEENACDRLRRCDTQVTFDQSSVMTLDASMVGFVSARHGRVPMCICKEKDDSCSDATTSVPIVPVTAPLDPCASNPCQSFMRCVPDTPSAAYSCVCADNSLSCGQGDASLRPMSFSGDSYVRYDLLDISSLYVRIAVAVHTVEPNGVLMHGEGDDFSTLELVDGYVKYTFDCGSGPANIRLTTKRVDDGAWHEVSISHTGSTATVTLDRAYSVTGSAAGDKRALNLNKLVFGARLTDDDEVRVRRETVSDGFVGCMGDMNVDGAKLERSGDGVVRADVGECPSRVLKACADDPCRHEGTCIDYGYSFVCDCRPGWNGPVCEFAFTPCNPDPCGHGGNCYSMGNDFQCDCNAPYSGRRCQEMLCPDEFCANGGVCEADPRACNCTGTGYGGQYCHQFLSQCTRNPCRQGLQCLPTADSYRCCSHSEQQDPEDSCSGLPPIPNMTSGPFGMVEIIAIVASVVVVIFLVLLFALIMRWRRRKRQSRDIPANTAYTMEPFLKKTDSRYPSSPPSPRPPPLPTRPASYTPSNHNSLNNLDSDRQCFADESQAYHGQPISQQPSLPPLPSNSASDSDSIAKPAWEFDPPSAHESYVDGRDSTLRGAVNHHPLQHSHPCILPPARHGHMPLEPPAYDQYSHAEMTSMSSNNTENEDDALPAYQWDCSDWMPTEPLSNIPEAQYENPDSPTHTLDVDDDDIEDEYVGDETDYPADSEHMPYPQGTMTHFKHQLASYPPGADNGVIDEDDDDDDDDESYVGYPSSSKRYQQHPNQYLPKHSVSNSTLPPPDMEYDDDELMTDRLPYPQRGSFPVAVSGRGPNPRFDLANAIASLDNMSMSVYTDTNASCSDVSGMCDPDSEMMLSEYDSVDGDNEEDEEDEEDELISDGVLSEHLKNLHTDV